MFGLRAIGKQRRRAKRERAQFRLAMQFSKLSTLFLDKFCIFEMLKQQADVIVVVI